jgi:hypothetical protein
VKPDRNAQLKVIFHGKPLLTMTPADFAAWVKEAPPDCRTLNRQRQRAFRLAFGFKSHARLLA